MVGRSLSWWGSTHTLCCRASSRFSSSLLLVAAQVPSESVVVNIRIVIVAVGIHPVEQLGTAQVLAETSHVTGGRGVYTTVKTYSEVGKRQEPNRQ